MPANAALSSMGITKRRVHLNCAAALTGAANSVAEFTKQPIAKHVTQRGAHCLVFSPESLDFVL